MQSNSTDSFRLIGLIVAGLVALWLAKALLLPLISFVVSVLWGLSGLVAAILKVAIFLGLVGGAIFGVLKATGVIK